MSIEYGGPLSRWTLILASAGLAVTIASHALVDTNGGPVSFAAQPHAFRWDEPSGNRHLGLQRPRFGLFVSESESGQLDI